MARLAGSAMVLFDGTFWSNDELIRLGIGERTALQLDHLPMSGSGGSLERLGTLPSRHRVYVHINNTNPVLLEDSAERRAVDAAGILVGMDGMRFDL
jgi:pyrroloquinoline quinone biosynthesis protein B